jgi:hypothetical protein
MVQAGSTERTARLLWLWAHEAVCVGSEEWILVSLKHELAKSNEMDFKKYNFLEILGSSTTWSPPPPTPQKYLNSGTPKAQLVVAFKLQTIYRASVLELFYVSVMSTQKSITPFS